METTSIRRVVVVTGASAGLGRTLARAFAEPGTAVGLLARGKDGLEAAAREVEERGGRPLVLVGDVADAAWVEQAAGRVEREMGAIDVWINNAMVSVFSPVHETPAEEFRRVTEVTYLGAVHGTLAALRRMRPRGRGVILQVGSALAYRGIPLQAAYCAAKHALQGFTESLRCELLHEGIGVRVLMVQLPAMNTPQFDWVRSRLPRRAQPVPPVFQPEVAAEVIRRAADHDDGRREIYVGWPTVKAIAGDRIAGSAGDRYVARHLFGAQQTDEPEDASRPDNLWQPLPGDHGAHGRFDDQARGWSWQAWATTRRRAVTLAAGALAVVGGLVAWRMARQPLP